MNGRIAGIGAGTAPPQNVLTQIKLFQNGERLMSARMALVSGQTRPEKVLLPIAHSSHPAVHPLAAPTNQHAYHEDLHPPKRKVPFTEFLVYREIAAFAKLRSIDYLDNLLQA